MAVTAKFIADFSSFQQAVQDAETRLVSFQGNANKVEGALNRMIDNFSGRKVIQDATLMAEAVDRIGGASKLTGTELTTISTKAQQAADKLRAMGQGVPEKLQALADIGRESSGVFATFTGVIDRMGASFIARVAEGVLLRDAIREVISVTKDAVTQAAAFENLSRATGIATDALQRLSFVGQDFGVDMETMARGVEHLSSRLAGGDKSASSAVAALGLNIQKLLASGPKDAFLDISEALGRIEDPMVRASYASEVFGERLSKQLLPSLGELRERMNNVPKGAIISEENIKLAHEFDVGVEHLETRLKSEAVTILGWAHAHKDAMAIVAPLFTFLADQVDRDAANAKGGEQPFLKPVAAHGTGTDTARTNAQLIQNQLDDLRAKSMVPLTSEIRAQIDALKEWGKSEDEIAKLVQKPVEAIHLYIEGLKSLKKAQEEADVIAVNGFEKRITAMQKVTEANLKAYSFGGQIASLYSLIQAEEALTRSVYGQLNSEKDRAKLVEELTLRRIELASQIQAIEQRQAEVVNAAVLAEFEARRKLDAAQGLNTQGYYGEITAADKLRISIDELHASRVEGISQEAQEILLTKEYTDAELARAQAEDAAIAKTQQDTDALKAKADAITNATAAAAKAAQDLGGKNAAVPSSESLTKAGIIASTISAESIPTGISLSGGRASGGPVSAGSSYLVGEKGPEVFTPGSNGSITPRGGGMSIGDIHIHGNVDSQATVDSLVQQIFRELQLHTPIQR